MKTTFEEALKNNEEQDKREDKEKNEKPKMEGVIEEEINIIWDVFYDVQEI